MDTFLSYHLLTLYYCIDSYPDIFQICRLTCIIHAISSLPTLVQTTLKVGYANLTLQDHFAQFKLNLYSAPKEFYAQNSFLL